MRNWMHWLITCYFQPPDAPPFPVRYLIKTPLIIDPAEVGEEPDGAWQLDWSVQAEVVTQHFLPQFKERVGQDFDGDVLYVEEQDVVVFEASQQTWN